MALRSQEFLLASFALHYRPATFGLKVLSYLRNLNFNRTIQRTLYSFIRTQFRMILKVAVINCFFTRPA